MSSDSTKNIHCDECGKNDLENLVFCEQCAAKLCKECSASIHSRKIMKGHTIYPFTQNNTDNTSKFKYTNTCQVHKGKEMALFCENDRIPICVYCQHENHLDHKVKLLHLSIQQLVSEALEKGDMILADNLLAATNEAQNKLQELKSSYESAVEKVNKDFDLLNVALNQTKQAVIQNIKPTEMENVLETFLLSSADCTQVLTNAIQSKENLNNLIKVNNPSTGSATQKLSAIEQLNIALESLHQLDQAQGIVSQLLSAGDELKKTTNTVIDIPYSNDQLKLLITTIQNLNTKQK